MFKKIILAIVVVSCSAALGHWLGFRLGYQTKVDLDISKIQRHNRTYEAAFSYVPLKAVLDKNNKHAVVTLCDILTGAINRLTELYDKNDSESANEIIDIITTITEWRKTSNLNFENSSKLDAALNEFNFKHNKSLSRIGAEASPPS